LHDGVSIVSNRMHRRRKYGEKLTPAKYPSVRFQFIERGQKEP
jgi:hypothetical protein